MTPDGLELPVPDRYCTDIPVTDIALLVGLYSSTKSWLYGAPTLPPPPNTSLITRAVPAGLACACGASAWRPMRAVAVETRAATIRRRVIFIRFLKKV